MERSHQNKESSPVAALNESRTGLESESRFESHHHDHTGKKVKVKSENHVYQIYQIQLIQDQHDQLIFLLSWHDYQISILQYQMTKFSSLALHHAQNNF